MNQIYSCGHEYLSHHICPLGTDCPARYKDAITEVAMATPIHQPFPCRDCWAHAVKAEKRKSYSEEASDGPSHMGVVTRAAKKYKAESVEDNVKVEHTGDGKAQLREQTEKSSDYAQQTLADGRSTIYAGGETEHCADASDDAGEDAKEEEAKVGDIDQSTVGASLHAPSILSTPQRHLVPHHDLPRPLSPLPVDLQEQVISRQKVRSWLEGQPTRRGEASDENGGGAVRSSEDEAADDEDPVRKYALEVARFMKANS